MFMRSQVNTDEALRKSKPGDERGALALAEGQAGAVVEGQVHVPGLLQGEGPVEPVQAERVPEGPHASKCNCIYASFLASVTVFMRRF